MPCFNANQGYKSKFLSKKGRRVFTQSLDKALFRSTVIDGVKHRVPVPMSSACHRCEGCRYKSSKEMAIRISHEAFMHDYGFNNSFITLTYNDEGLPPLGGLDYFGDWDRFLQSLRDHLALEGIRIRYYMVGEYGDKYGRPHYHAIIFGYNFPDKQFLYADNCNVFYTSDLLKSFWTAKGDRNGRGFSLGYHSISDVNFTVAAYCARYNMKKLIGNHYDDLSQYEDSDGVLIPKRVLRFHPETGDAYAVARERALMSKRPGIAKSWFDMYARTDFYEKDFMHDHKGRIIRPPSYYDKCLDKIDSKKLDQLRKTRQAFAEACSEKYTPQAIDSARLNLIAKLSRSQRKL